VLLDGQVIFSKAQAGRFPIDGEVEEIFVALKPDAKTSTAAKVCASDPPKEQNGGKAGVLRRLADKFRN
jgi:hypothetical protein